MSRGETTGAQAFRLETRTQGDEATLAVHGELDLGTSEAVERAVRALREGGVHAIVLDLRPLAFIDSSGLRLLLQLDAEARADGFGFAIAAGDGPVRRLLELTNLTDGFQRARL